MALKLSVKIGNVTNLSDARYAAGMGVDYIGFNINNSSENLVKANTFKEITNWISGVGIIGEIGENHPINKEEYPAYLTETTNSSQLNEESILRFNVRKLSFAEIEDLFNPTYNVHFYILDLSANQVEDYKNELASLCANWPIYISSDFNEALLSTVVNTIKPKGIEIKGGLEEQPGFKDYDGIADVLEWLEEEE